MERNLYDRTDWFKRDGVSRASPSRRAARKASSTASSCSFRSARASHVVSVSRTALTLRRSAARFSNSCAVDAVHLRVEKPHEQRLARQHRRLPGAQEQEVAALNLQSGNARNPQSIRSPQSAHPQCPRACGHHRPDHRHLVAVLRQRPRAVDRRLARLRRELRRDALARSASSRPPAAATESARRRRARRARCGRRPLSISSTTAALTTACVQASRSSTL